MYEIKIIRTPHNHTGLLHVLQVFHELLAI